MTARSSLSDAALEAMLARRASRARPEGLHGAITSTVATMGQQRRPWPGRPGWLVVQPERRLLWAIAIVGLLMALGVGTALVGSRLLDRTRDRSEFVPSGIDLVTPDPGRYEQAVADRDGTVWAIGWGKLAHYDPVSGSGRTWSIADDLRFGARSIVAGRDGGVWLVGRRSLDRFDGIAFRQTLDAGVSIAAATESRAGDAWVASEDGTVLRLSGASPLRIDAPPPGPGATVAAIAIDAAGDVWLAWHQYPERGWVARYDGSSWRLYDGDDTPSLGGDVGAILATPIATPSDGTVWVGTAHGLARFDGASWTDLTGAGPPLLDVGSLAIAEDGAVWAASTVHDVGRVIVARFVGPVRTTFDGGAIDAYPSLLAADGRVFAGSGAGLHELKGDGWQHVWPKEPPAGPAAFDSGTENLLATSRTEAWRGYFDDVWHFAAGTWSRMPPLGSRVNDLVRTSDGTLWACARFSGLFRSEGPTWAVVAAGDAGCALATDETGRLWVVQPDSEGWSLRSYAYDGRTWIEGTRAPTTDLVMGPERVAIGAEGAVWVGGGGVWGYKGGLVRYVNGTWEMVDPRGNRADYIVSDLLVAPNGDVWVAGQDVPKEAEATGQGWVACFHGSTWTVYLPADILPSADPLALRYELISDLAAGPDGTVWAAGGGGLARFDGADWTILYRGIWFGAVSVAPDGTVWVDSTHGTARLTDPSTSR